MCLKYIVGVALVSGAVLLGKGYSMWSMDRHLRAVAANAAAPGIPIQEFERQKYGDKRGAVQRTPR